MRFLHLSLFVVLAVLQQNYLKSFGHILLKLLEGVFCDTRNSFLHLCGDL